MRPAIELARPYEWPGAPEDAEAGTHTLVVSLEGAPGEPLAGWLRLEFEGEDTTARHLFARGIAQSLAIALRGFATRDDERLRAQALARREQAVSRYLGDVSNEIRTPLTLLLGPLEAAVERRFDSGLAMALRQGQRLRRQVETLLDLSVIDAGRIDPVLLPIDIAALTRDVASLFHEAAITAGVALTVDCPTLPQAVHVDRTQWEQVVINLLGNAIRFAPSAEVRISLGAHIGLMTLEVTDTGPGIAPEELQDLFERFRTSRANKDRGLGLALVRELVRLHGGDIEAVSVQGQGTRFRVCLPMLGKPAPLVPHRRVVDLATRLCGASPMDALGWPTRSAGPPAIDAATDSESTRRERIVLIVAHRELRDYVGGLLRERYRVQSLPDGADALQAVAHRGPDLILVDLGATSDSLAFMRQLRATANGAVLPALLLTSDAYASAHANAIEAGADDIIAKPFAATELLARVGAHMRLSAARRALHRRLTSHNHELEAEVIRRTQALAASEEQFKAISNLVPDILWRTDAEGRLEWRNEQWGRFTGDQRPEPGADCVHPEDRAATQAWITETIAGRRQTPHEYRLRRQDGVYHWFIARMSPVNGTDGRIERWFGSATDIEAHHRARHALETRVDEGNVALAHATGLQQELLHQLSRSQEDERRRIARELHDSMGQYLTALKLALSALAPALDDPHLRGLVEHLDMLTMGLDRELDDAIAALRPAMLDEFGLVGALPILVSQWSRQTGIVAEILLVQTDDKCFDEESESTLYRVVQESLTNVVKHARARNVVVTLTRLQDDLHLTVEDDGVGFDVAQFEGGWGLRGMAERARILGGLLQVESTPEGGTTVLVRLPCKPRVLRATDPPRID